jgi:hypothetical protein
LIFDSEDIKSVLEAEVEAMIRNQFKLEADAPMTIKTTDSGYTFFNFGFDSG